MSMPTVYAVINSVIPTFGLPLGEGLGRLRLKVRFLLIDHPAHGLILVDGGYGPEIRDLKGMKGSIYRRVIGAPSDYLTPVEAMKALGYNPDELRHVVLTHLHADHLCNLSFLPEKTSFHLSKPSYATLQAYRSEGRAPGLKGGMFPELLPRSLYARAELVEEKTASVVEGCEGFDLFDDRSILVVPLPGHAEGHFGLFLPQVEGQTHGLFYAVDTAWTMKGLKTDREAFAGRVAGHAPEAARSSRLMVNHLSNYGHLVVLCHDPGTTALDFNPRGF